MYILHSPKCTAACGSPGGFLMCAMGPFLGSQRDARNRLKLALLFMRGSTLRLPSVTSFLFPFKIVSFQMLYISTKADIVSVQVQLRVFQKLNPEHSAS